MFCSLLLQRKIDLHNGFVLLDDTNIFFSYKTNKHIEFIINQINY